jgi:hypothetical protein
MGNENINAVQQSRRKLTCETELLLMLPVPPGDNLVSGQECTSWCTWFCREQSTRQDHPGHWIYNIRHHHEPGLPDRHPPSHEAHDYVYECWLQAAEHGRQRTWIHSLSCAATYLDGRFVLLSDLLRGADSVASVSSSSVNSVTSVPPVPLSSGQSRARSTSCSQ